MEAFVVEGGTPLRGEIRVDGAKNATLPILAAAVLTEETVRLHDVPEITDVKHMADILTMLGCQVTRENSDMTVTCAGCYIRGKCRISCRSRFARPFSCWGLFWHDFIRPPLLFPAAVRSASVLLICICPVCAASA